LHGLDLVFYSLFIQRRVARKTARWYDQRDLSRAPIMGLSKMDLIYPIGRGELEGEVTPERRREWVMDIEVAPALLRAAVEGLTEEQLDTPYRDGGWAPRQLVHHLYYSNINSYVRFKLAVTEEEPTVKVWDQI
jgi:hypothetical protein